MLRGKSQSGRIDFLEMRRSCSSVWIPVGPDDALGQAHKAALRPSSRPDTLPKVVSRLTVCCKGRITSRRRMGYKTLFVICAMLNQEISCRI